jgi:hypothetical protein
MSHNPIQDGKPPDRVNEAVYVQQTILEVEEIELMRASRSCATSDTSATKSTHDTTPFHQPLGYSTVHTNNNLIKSIFTLSSPRPVAN